MGICIRFIRFYNLHLKKYNSNISLHNVIRIRLEIVEIYLEIGISQTTSKIVQKIVGANIENKFYNMKTNQVSSS